MIILFLFFFTVMGIIFSGFNIFSVWIRIEIITFSTLVLFINRGKVYPLGRGSMKYFIVQSFSALSILIFCGMAFSEDQRFFLHRRYDMGMFAFLSFMAIWMKRGLIPFHQWILDILKKSNAFIFWVINVWNKIISLFFLYFQEIICCIPSFLLKFVFVLNLITVILNLTVKSSFFWIFFFSGIMHAINILILIMESVTPQTVFLYLIFYVLFMLFMLMSLNSLVSLDDSLERLKKNNSFRFLFLIFSLSGFPPSFFFFLKIFFMKEISSERFFFMIYLLVLSSTYMFFLINSRFKKLMSELFTYGDRTTKQSNLKPYYSFFFLMCLLF